MRIAVIPARGGSKRIPRKNIRLFDGKPIITYSIQAAQNTGLFREIVVSTDDEEIANVARSAGASVPFLRPANLADDYTGTDAVTAHAVDWFVKAGRKPSHACCIYATSPFLTSATITRGYEALIASGKDFAFAVTSFPYPVQRALRVMPDGSVEMMDPRYRQTRSQDLEEAYHDAGQFYWGRAEAYLAGIQSFSSKAVAVVLPRHLVQDIDTLEDWRRAEFMYQAVMLTGDLSR